MCLYFVRKKVVENLRSSHPPLEFQNRVGNSRTSSVITLVSLWCMCVLHQRLQFSSPFLDILFKNNVAPPTTTVYSLAPQCFHSHLVSMKTFGGICSCAHSWLPNFMQVIGQLLAPAALSSKPLGKGPDGLKGWSGHWRWHKSRATARNQRHFFFRLPIPYVSYCAAWAIPDRSCFVPWRKEEIWGYRRLSIEDCIWKKDTKREIIKEIEKETRQKK